MARGDHIKVRRCRGLYSHHGIDMGDGTVIHFSGEPCHRRDARVCRVRLEEFLAGGRLSIVRHHGVERSPEDVAAQQLRTPGHQVQDRTRPEQASPPRPADSGQCRRRIAGIAVARVRGAQIHRTIVWISRRREMRGAIN